MAAETHWNLWWNADCTREHIEEMFTFKERDFLKFPEDYYNLVLLLILLKHVVIEVQIKILSRREEIVAWAAADLVYFTCGKSCSYFR